MRPVMNAKASPEVRNRHAWPYGSDYSGTYGITTSGNALNLEFVTKGQYSTNIGSRTYLMKETNTYEMFKLINEFSFDIDLSQLPCGLNRALYFVSMPEKGQGAPGRSMELVSHLVTERKHDVDFALCAGYCNAQFSNAQVVFSNIRFCPIGSTFAQPAGT